MLVYQRVPQNDVSGSQLCATPRPPISCDLVACFAAPFHPSWCRPRLRNTKKTSRSVEVFKIFSSILSKHCPNTYQSEQIVLSLHPMAPYPWFFWCLGMCRSSGSNYRSSVNCRMQFGTQKIIKNPWPPILGAQLLIKWFWVQWCPFFWSYAPNAPGFPRLCFRWPSGTRSFSLRTWKGRNKAPKMFVRWGLEIHIGSLTCVYHYISSLVLLS